MAEDELKLMIALHGVGDIDFCILYLGGCARIPELIRGGFHGRSDPPLTLLGLRALERHWIPRTHQIPVSRRGAEFGLARRCICGVEEQAYKKRRMPLAPALLGYFRRAVHVVLLDIASTASIRIGKRLRK
jgi:hypothetical protein